jgi:sodium/potassium-transporting ATPase subunit alpha
MLSDTKAMVAKRRGKPIEEIGENDFKAIVVHGEQVDSLTDTEWDNIFWKDEIIFARTSPKHKLEIVRRAQSMGHMYAPKFISSPFEDPTSKNCYAPQIPTNIY